MNKGFNRMNRIQDYIQDYPFKFFVTLTFADKFLPLARYSDEDYALYHDFDCDYDGVVNSCSLSSCNEKDIKLICNMISKYGGVPVLSHRVLILFKKRFRENIKKLNLENNDLFIYGCGEYGPEHFRPHYHLCVGCRSFIRTDVFKKCVDKAWSYCTQTKSECIYTQFGYTYVERFFNGKSVEYIAKYLSCTTHLPTFLQDTKWKPFACGSTRCTEQLSRLSQSDLREVFYKPTFEVSVLRNGKYINEPVPPAYYNRFFPLVTRFRLFGDYELYSLYSLYNKFPDVSRSYLDFMCDYDRQIDLGYLFNRNHSFDSPDCIQKPEDLLHMCVDLCCFIDCDGKFIEDEFIKRRNFMRLYYVSRRVCLNAKELDISVSTYVDKIIDYYNKLELRKLKNFYEFQSELLLDAVHPVDVDYLYTLYYHTDGSQVDTDYYAELFGFNGRSINDSDIQRVYIQSRKSILLNTTKTKKRNDTMYSQGLQPKPYVPIISHSINKFLTI